MPQIDLIPKCLAQIYLASEKTALVFQRCLCLHGPDTLKPGRSDFTSNIVTEARVQYRRFSLTGVGINLKMGTASSYDNQWLMLISKFSP